ncbi:hypothetical protein ACWGOE_07330 [Leucobacter chromiiresistens]
MIDHVDTDIDAALAAEEDADALVDADGYKVRTSPRAEIEYRVMSVLDAVENGTELELLFALRTQIAKQLSNGVSPRDLASLSRRLIELGKDIEAAEEAEIEEGGGVDDEPDEDLDGDDL